MVHCRLFLTAVKLCAMSLYFHHRFFDVGCSCRLRLMACRRLLFLRLGLLQAFDASLHPAPFFLLLLVKSARDPSLCFGGEIYLPHRLIERL